MSSPAATAELPRPADRPAADVVLYDGLCNFCRARIKQLTWWDCQQRLAYLSIHDPEVAERWPQLDRARLDREMCVVESNGQQHWGADAVRYLSRRLRRLWWLAPLLYVPGAMPLWRALYRLVADNRYRLGGRRIECDSDRCSLYR